MDMGKHLLSYFFHPRVAEGHVTGARGDGVKTKNWCEDVFSGPPGVVLNIIFRKTPRIWATIFCHPPRKCEWCDVEWRTVTSADTSIHPNTIPRSPYAVVGVEGLSQQHGANGWRFLHTPGGPGVWPAPIVRSKR